MVGVRAPHGSSDSRTSSKRKRRTRSDDSEQLPGRARHELALDPNPRMQQTGVDHFTSPEAMKARIAVLEGDRNEWRRIAAHFEKALERIAEDISEPLARQIARYALLAGENKRNDGPAK